MGKEKKSDTENFDADMMRKELTLTIHRLTRILDRMDIQGMLNNAEQQKLSSAKGIVKRYSKLSDVLR